MPEIVTSSNPLLAQNDVPRLSRAGSHLVLALLFPYDEEVRHVVYTVRMKGFMGSGAILCALLSSLAQAKVPFKSRPSPVPPILYQRPKHLLTDDQYYLRYFGKNDPSLKESYKEPTKLPTTPQERGSLASGVLRSRLRSSFETYLSDLKGGAKLSEIHKKLEAVKTHSFALSKDENGRPSAELVMSFDPFTNSSRVEYLKGPIEAGVHDNAFLNTLTSPGSRWSQASLNVNTNLGLDAPRAEVCYLLNGDYVTTTLRKRLSETMEGAISKRQPIKTPEHLYEIRFFYSF